MYLEIFGTYLLLINIIFSIIFIFDKFKAATQRRRIPENTLHFLELLGGVFSSLFLIYKINHKSNKFTYYFVTYLIFLIWVGILIFLVKNYKNFV